MTNAVIPPAAPADLVELGRITGAYGVKGWVKIQPHSANADVLLSISQWWLMRSVPVTGQGSATPVPSAIKVQTARPQGATVVAQLAGIADRDQAEALRGMGVYASRSIFPEPEQDEYYWVDLIGCTLFGQEEGVATLMGVVDDVLDNGAHAILKVRRLSCKTPDAAPETVLDAKGKPVEVLVPFVHVHIQNVDLAARRIDSDWPLEF
jgi:16S rRNA processing protein RimM